VGKLAHEVPAAESAGPHNEELAPSSTQSSAREVGSQPVKLEEDVQEACVAEFEKSDFASFRAGFVQIDSSSGSSSCSSNDSASDSDSDDPGGSDPKGLMPAAASAFREVIPDGLEFAFRKKSKILRKKKVGAGVFACKTKCSANFTALCTVVTFRFLKCLKCFLVDHNRVRTVDEVVDHLDRFAKRCKSN